jgi:hypothetical protein
LWPSSRLGFASTRQSPDLASVRHVQIWHAVLHKIIIAPAKV